MNLQTLQINSPGLNWTLAFVSLCILLIISPFFPITIPTKLRGTGICNSIFTITSCIDMRGGDKCHLDIELEGTQNFVLHKYPQYMFGTQCNLSQMYPHIKLELTSNSRICRRNILFELFCKIQKQKLVTMFYVHKKVENPLV